MKLERKHALFLLAVAVWNVLTYARFTKALMDDHSGRPTAYFVAHGFLIVVNVLIAIVLARWGWRALKAAKAPQAGDAQNRERTSDSVKP